MQHPFDYTYLMWNMAKAGLSTIIGATRLGQLWSYAFHCVAIEGIFCEVGVYKGGSAYAISDALEAAGSSKPFYMVDTFTGHPYSHEKDKGMHKKGDFFVEDSQMHEIIKALATLRKGNQVFVSKIEDVYPKKDDRFAFVHVDTDTYQSVKYCLETFWPAMNSGGIIVLDDPMMDGCPGARAALDESIAALVLRPIVIPSRQVVLIKGFGYAE